LRRAAQEIRVLLLAAAAGPRPRSSEGKELLEGASGIRANAGNEKLRPDLERFCADTFERMKTSSDIKDCMSK
jgi:hypothetical protein